MKNLSFNPCPQMRILFTPFHQKKRGCRKWEAEESHWGRLLGLGNGGGKADLVCPSFVSYENEKFGFLSQRRAINISLRWFNYFKLSDGYWHYLTLARGSVNIFISISLPKANFEIVPYKGRTRFTLLICLWEKASLTAKGGSFL